MLQSNDIKRTTTYKNLQSDVKHHNIIAQTDKIRELIKTNKLTIEDMPFIDDLNNLITNGTLEAEASLKRPENREPWSPDFVNTIREVFMWKLVKSDKLGKI